MSENTPALFEKWQLQKHIERLIPLLCSDAVRRGTDSNVQSRSTDAAVAHHCTVSKVLRCFCDCLNQGFPTFLRSRTTWAPRAVNAYHYLQSN